MAPRGKEHTNVAYARSQDFHKKTILWAGWNGYFLPDSLEVAQVFAPRKHCRDILLLLNGCFSSYRTFASVNDPATHVVERRLVFNCLPYVLE